ncbi:MAG: nitroreductase family protein [Haloarculaceae archaeon]
MDVTEAVQTRIDLREYSDEPVEGEIKREILDAARVASSGRNTQHWRFILLQDEDRIAELSERTSSGSWIGDATFAVAVLTNPEWDFHKMDAGKAITHMQLVAWEHGVGSGMFTTDDEAVYEFLEAPEKLELSATVGFGYPTKEIKGIKDRRPLEEIAYSETFGTELDIDD